jgi:putative transposase
MEGHGLYRRRRLPHWDLPGATYFITTCLAGSIPAEGLLDLTRYRAGLQELSRTKKKIDTEWELLCWKKTFARCDWWLDQRPAVRHLTDSALAAIVEDAFFFWAGCRYDLLAYIVMPSHIHWVFRPLVGQVANLPGNRSSRERIMHTLKLHTALECNRQMGCSGVFWQEESYDHCVRDNEELERIIQYVEFNPVKAKLVASPKEWSFSSAHYRAKNDLLLGQPLMRSTQ